MIPRYEKGLVIPLVALLSLTIFGLLAMVIELGAQMTLKQRLTVAAEAAAHATAMGLKANQNLVARSGEDMHGVLRKYQLIDGQDSVIVNYSVGRYALGHFQSFGQQAIGFRNGVGLPAWANSVSVTVSKQSPTFFGKILGRTSNHFIVSSSAMATVDSTETQCAAPLVIPICGLAMTTPSPGDISSALNTQEIIFGHLPLPSAYPQGRLPISAPDPRLTPGLLQLQPLRGGFGVVTPSGYQPVTAQNILSILTSQWPPSSIGAGLGKGCVPARLGDRVSVFTNGDFGAAQTAQINNAIVSLVNQTQPELFRDPNAAILHPTFYYAHSVPQHPLVPVFEEGGQNAICDIHDAQYGPMGGASEYPQGKGGCHTSAQHIGTIPGMNITTAVPQRAPNNPGKAWRVKVMVIAPSENNSMDYCSPVNTRIDNHSQPVIVGFVTMEIFDLQLFTPGNCVYKTPNPPLGWIRHNASQNSCRGVRARPSLAYPSLTVTSYGYPAPWLVIE